MSKKVKSKRKPYVDKPLTAEERKILDDPKGWITGTGTPMVKRKIEKKTKKRSKKKEKTVLPEVSVDPIFPSAGVT